MPPEPLFGHLTSGLLAKFFVLPMILQRYRSKIIVEYITVVQSSYATSPAPLLARCATTAKSYLSQTTALKSYLTNSRFHSDLDNFQWPILLVTPLIGLATSGSVANSSLLDFCEKSCNHKDEDDKQTDNSERYDDTVKAAYGYARQSQSSTDGNSETMSIGVQKQHISSVAEELELSIAEIFVDMDESGFSFDRDGFKSLEEHLEQDPRPVILDRINRLGRNTLETIHVAATIHYEYEVKIITYRNGMYDLDSTSDQITLVIEAITAGKSVEDRIRAAWDTIRKKFEEEKVWNTWFANTRLGYRLPENEDWPEVVSGGAEVVSAIMKDVVETKNYSKVSRLIKECANNERIEGYNEQKYCLPELPGEQLVSVFEHSDLDIDSINGAIIRRIVSDPIYVGRVVFPRNAESSDQTEIEQPDLQLVEQELFERVNKVVDEISEKHSTTTDSVDIERLSDMGLMMKTLEEIDVIKPICDHCGRGMVKNRSETLKDGTKCHYWVCPEYYNNGEVNSNHDQRKFPREKEWEALKDHAEDERSDVVVLRIKPFEY